MVVVRDHHWRADVLVEHLGVLPGKLGQLSDGGVFLKDHLAVGVGKDLQWVALLNAERAADLLGDHNAPQVVNAAYNTGSFHRAYLLIINVSFSVIFYTHPKVIFIKGTGFFCKIGSPSEKRSLS
jgi:hypothetical protein